MHEVEPDAVSLEIQFFGPGRLGVVIAQDNADRPSQLLKFGQDFLVTHVTEMPDFVGWCQVVEQFFWITVVRIGDDRDAQRHGEKKADFRRQRKDRMLGKVRSAADTVCGSSLAKSRLLSNTTRQVGQSPFNDIATMTLKVKRLDPAAKLPVRTTPGASCFDIHALVGGTIPAKSRALIRTGLAVAVDKGFEVQVRSRSGLALKQGVFVINSPGTIDSDYRGEVGIILMNLGDDTFTYKAGDRIAQIAVCAVVMGDAELVESLDDTQRSAGGFGSTGL